MVAASGAAARGHVDSIRLDRPSHRASPRGPAVARRVLGTANPPGLRRRVVPRSQIQRQNVGGHWGVGRRCGRGAGVAGSGLLPRGHRVHLRRRSGAAAPRGEGLAAPRARRQRGRNAEEVSARANALGLSASTPAGLPHASLGSSCSRREGA
eukprot:363360-Chlamydomonas_euryale.AAC.4